MAENEGRWRHLPPRNEERGGRRGRGGGDGRGRGRGGRARGGGFRAHDENQRARQNDRLPNNHGDGPNENMAQPRQRREVWRHDQGGVQRDGNQARPGVNEEPVPPPREPRELGQGGAHPELRGPRQGGEHPDPRGPRQGGERPNRGGAHRGGNRGRPDNRNAGEQNRNHQLQNQEADDDHDFDLMNRMAPLPPMNLPQPRHRIGYTALQQFLLLESDVLLATITQRRSGFPDALQDPALLSRPNCVASMLAIIASAVSCETAPAAIHVLLNTIRTSQFLNMYLAQYFTGMQLEASAAKLRGFKQPIKDALILYRQLLHRFPESVMVVQRSFVVLDYIIKGLRADTNAIDDEIDKSLQETLELQQDTLQRQKNSKKGHEMPKEEGHPKQDVVQPPNDYRQISIFPNVEDDIVPRTKPFLRENVIKGAFESAEHYLDVQFRLLREDFVQPLRKGIHEYRELHAEDGNGRQRRRLTDIRIYHDVCVLNPVCSPGGIQYRIRFDAARMGHVNWRYSKRLIYGSLLCLSSDDFMSIRIATVAQRDPDLLKDGELTIAFETDLDGVRHIRPDERFLMVETSAYFEAYRHVLVALQNSREQDIPFLENIVLCEERIEPPQYLRTAEEPLFDFRAISGVKVQDADMDEDLVMTRHEIGLAAVPVLQRARWPSAQTLHLDESQLKALQTALTRRIAIIQGPPGTGKTYIGLKIVQVLLENKHIWNPHAPEENSPILVVCYTNHALDQFLEGLCHFVKRDVVRVGGRSKSKKLEQFLLRELRKQTRENRNVPRQIFLNRINARSEMELWQTEIERQAAMIEGTERGLIHESVLHEYMLEEHYEALVNNYWPDAEGTQFGVLNQRSGYHGHSTLPEWLGLVNMINLEEQENQHADNVPQAQDGGEQPQDAEPAEDPDEDAGEVQAEEDERILEGADDEEAALRRLQEQRRRERNIQRADEQLAVNFDNILNAAAEAAAAAAAAGDAGGLWATQPKSRKRKRQLLRRGLQSKDVMPRDEAERIPDIWALTINNRWRLYRYWLSQYRLTLRENILDSERNYQIAANRMKEILEEEDMAIMRRMKIIGMTTTGAARYINTLRRIQPKIVIVEEAAEVLEAHVTTTLSGHCQHLILIGDHKQLRPNPNVYELAEKYNLKYSLFERLVTNNLEHETLQRQHRMRPEIADFMRIIYEGLVDDASVHSYENIKGVSRNIYFISHVYEEQKDDELKSVSNEHEARYLVALCRYLVLQGYGPAQITILTPYIGQVFQLKRLMRGNPTLEGVHLCPIDNYQGEENDIILLSMVRSNYEKKIGFVKEENRTCVALSRAKMGLFVIGNFDQLRANSNLWSKVVGKAKEKNCFGESLRLCCQNHADAQIEARTAQDFNQAPEGGCLRPCGYRLKCGHVCEMVCHSYDREHLEYKCQKPCQKTLCAAGHKCKRLCKHNCGPCMEPIRRRLTCGHQQMVPCSVPVHDFQCKAECSHLLSCGHACQNRCGEEHTKECGYAISKKCLKGHMSIIKCYQHLVDIPCREPCGVKLQCTHDCSSTCGECLSGYLHSPCTAKCGRTLVCGHPCNEPCTTECPPCGRKCENRCNHSRCPRDCGRPCEPCVEPCLWRCAHHRCSKLCHEPCDRPRCDEPCYKQLPCGHPCIGMCGERCPDKCRVCHRDEVTEIFFGMEDEPDARFVQLEDCRHLIEVSALDQWMDQAMDRTTAIGIQLKQCPKCKVPIRKNLRYGPVINQILTDIEIVKRRIIGDIEENKRRAHRLTRELKESGFNSEVMLFYANRLKVEGLSNGELTCIENVMRFSEHVHRWQREIQTKIRRQDDETKRKLEALQADIKGIVHWINTPRTRLSPQETVECSMEITRFDLLSTFYQFEGRIKSSDYPNLTDEKRQKFSVMLRQLKSGSPLNEDIEREAREVLKQTERCMTGLGITNEERIQIVQAMALGQGHWFKCPNGHIYAIGECGGAEQTSKCSECGAAIGGGQHRLLEGNRFAPEMDGARAPAWPGTAMNP